jgi:hypothetical protein
VQRVWQSRLKHDPLAWHDVRALKEKGAITVLTDGDDTASKLSSERGQQSGTDGAHAQELSGGWAERLASRQPPRTGV